MAVIDYSYNKSVNDAHVVTWETVTTDDTGAVWSPKSVDGAVASVQFSGTFNGGTTAVLQVSNDNTTWFTAKDTAGTDVSATADAFFELSISGLYVRPSVSSGSSDDIDVVLVLRK